MPGSADPANDEGQAMDDQLISKALEGATDTHEVRIAQGALSSVNTVFGRCFGERAVVIVADGNTWDAAGARVADLLSQEGRPSVEPYVFPGRPVLYASYDNVGPLVESLRTHDAVPVAVGAGTLNDIVKRAAHEAERPYMAVATAASMDGYSSFGASLAKDGHKQTVSCPAPRAVVADLDVLVAAPSPMTAYGYGDLLGKVPAGADWLIADALGVEAIDTSVWSLVQGPLRASIGRPSELRAGDVEAVGALVEGLIMSGLAMQAHASSRPASGAEHQFSHLWEMEGLGRDDDPPLSHGFKVGVGSIAIAALYERLLARDLAAIDIDAVCDRWPSPADLEATVLDAHPLLGAVAVKQTSAKYITADQLRERLKRLANAWPTLRDRLGQQLLPPDELRDMLAAAGCPTEPGHIGLDVDAFRATYRRSQMIRSRYTVLDLAIETGLLDECVDELFAPGGYWSHL